MKMPSVESTITIRFVTVQKNSPEIHSFVVNLSLPVPKNQSFRNDPILVFHHHAVIYCIICWFYRTPFEPFLKLGPNSKCQVVSNQAQCGCQDGMIGSVPNCRPECVRNSDCPSNQACINQKCKDPCAGICGPNTQCRVVGHNPVCSCKDSYTGDPFRSCVPIQRKILN